MTHAVDRAVRKLRVGERGMIERIVISDPRDGDSTFLIFYVRFDSVTAFLAGYEFAPAVDAEAHAWAKRQIDSLGGAR